MLNHITLMGRLVRDPELRYTQSQTPVVSFRIAVDRDFGARDGGERQADFIDIVAWRQTAEFVNKYFQKGRMIVVSGRLQMRDWTDRDNNKRTSAEVVADNVYFGDSRRDGDANRGDSYAGGYSNSYANGNNASTNGNSYGGYNAGRAPAPAPAPANTFVELDDGDGELPF